MRIVCGVNDGKTEKDKEYYFKEKEEAKKLVRSALHADNREVMSKLVRMGGNSCITI